MEENRKYRILIVDDVIMNRMLLKEIMEEFALDIQEAENGKQAIEVLESGNTIDIILLDIEMPVMNGLETARHIRNKLEYPLNKTPIIALTAYNPSDFFQDIHDTCFDNLVTKPYSINKVLNALSSVNL